MTETQTQEVYHNPPALPSLDPALNGPVIPMDTQLQNLTASEARMKANEFRDIAMRLDPSSSAYQQITAMAAMAEARATQAELEDAEDDTPGATRSRGGLRMFLKDLALTKAMADFIKDPREIDYLNSIRTDRHYDILAIDANGNIVRDASGSQKTEQVSGEELREDFARIKFHTLSKEDQEKVKAKEEELKKNEPGHPQQSEAKTPLAKEKEEMQKLQKSVDHLEGHEAKKTMEAAEEASRGKTSEEREAIYEAARQTIREKHHHFDEARKQAQEVIKKTEEIEKKGEHVKGLETMASTPPATPALAMQQTLARLALPEAQKNLERSTQEAAKDIDGMKKELGETLQKGVIHKGLLGDKDEQPQQAKSQDRQVAIRHDKDAGKEVVVPAMAHAAPQSQSAGRSA